MCSGEEDAHEHHSETVTRNGFRAELVRFGGDNITHVSPVLPGRALLRRYAAPLAQLGA